MNKKVLWIVVFLIFGKIFPSYSISPGKWSVLDRYVLGLEKNGPKEEKVKDVKGNLIYSAKYEYDENGRLIKETYFKANGEQDGETIYTYELNRVVSEELFSKLGAHEKKVFKYSPNGDLKEILAYDAQGKEIMRCKVTGLWKELISDGEIKWLSLKESETFSLKKSSENPKLYIQEVYNEKRELVTTVRFFLNEKNEIIKRENIQANSKRMSEIQYNETGKIIGFSFYIFKDGDWKLQKTHELIYE